MPDKDNMNIFKCHCNYHLGMGPNLQCPLHGTRKNLHAGVVRRRAERERVHRDHLVIKNDLELQVKRLSEMLATRPPEVEPEPEHLPKEPLWHKLTW